MRAFELLFIALLMAGLIVRSRSTFTAKTNLLVFSAVTAIGLLQVVCEGFRWQMALAFLCYLSYLFSIRSLFTKNLSSSDSADSMVSAEGQFTPATIAKDHKLSRLSVALLLTSLALGVLVPIVKLPDPQGTYAVGTSCFHLIDYSRREIFARDSDKKRELMIQVWYPADRASLKTDTDLAPYMTDSNDIAPFLSTIPFAVAASHLHLIKTHAHLGVPIAKNEARYPVLIFSHGLMGGRIQNTMQAEEFASNGYVVVGIDHTYDCAFAVFPTGTISSQLITAPSPVPPLLPSGLGVRVADVHFVLDELQKLNANNVLFKNRLDLDRLGVYGHSLGGQTALLVCAADKRFKAGLSMDGFVPVPPQSITQPFMMMQAERAGDAFNLRTFFRLLKYPHFIVTVKNSEHANFTDLPLLTPLHFLLGLSGSIDGLRAMKLIDAYSLAFFDRYLKGRHEVLLDGPVSDYPEVIVEGSVQNARERPKIPF